ncbi:ParB N-terminal domain-containing protein [Pseudodesulfovibrio sp.]|uniref:ParB N-terminal domain-containing protein n=1 Tax=Pseudodesulfovibrio sp. TaxID=2035812 RepID=UPI0026315160|nr:ParB N-terminal domain-containing protein [Pseudodesulfovibrio sp.]MDD3310972.1 ParB N-terminal domain-containing protein [Pseudodesulfovibrio sp.]
MYIQAINPIDADHLREIINTMRGMGAPEIRVYHTGEMYLALEGSHRLAAAWELGLTPIIIEMEEDDEMPDHDVETYGAEGNTVGTILEYVGAGAQYNMDLFDCPEDR